MTTPSITMPAFTCFHKATNSLRASATIIVFLKRPPLRATRSLNQQEAWSQAGIAATATQAQPSSFAAVDCPLCNPLLAIDRAALPWRRR